MSGSDFEGRISRCDCHCAQLDQSSEGPLEARDPAARDPSYIAIAGLVRYPIGLRLVQAIDDDLTLLLTVDGSLVRMTSMLDITERELVKRALRDSALPQVLVDGPARRVLHKAKNFVTTRSI